MKSYHKWLMIAGGACCVLLVGIMAWVLHTYQQFKGEAVIVAEPEYFAPEGEGKPEDIQGLDLDPYNQLIKESNRVNILMMGIAGYLSDTLMVLSYDPDTKDFDMISVPRDTYYEREGYPGAAAKKINAAYNVKENRAQSVMNGVRDILQIPIHGYVKVDYQAVRHMVDAIGGVTVDIPEKMYYYDPVEPLLIQFSKGTTTLNGEEAVKYLRYRNDRENDFGRMKRQQEFINAFLKKAMGMNLLKLVDVAKDYVETNMDFTEALTYVREFLRAGQEAGNRHIIPGTAAYIGNTAYFFHDEEGTRELITKIYQGKSDE